MSNSQIDVRLESIEERSASIACSSIAMTNQTHFSRPAIAAIAAVLAFSTAPAMAQPAADEPAVEPSLPPVAAEPSSPAEAVPSAEPAPVQPAPVQIAPPAEVVQRIPADQSEAEASVPPAAAPRARVEPARPATATAVPSPAKEVLTRPVAPPAAAPVADPGIDIAAARPAPVAQPSAANVDIDNAAWWALGAGGLLFVGGLGAVAFARSRRQPDLARARRTKDRAPTAVKSSTVEPAVAAEAAIAVPQPITINAAARTTQRRVKAASSDRSALEDMVAEAPSPANPFLTRSKRMRRAKFLLEHGQPQPLSQPAAQAAGEARQEAGSKTAGKVANPKSSPTYSFGGRATPRINWKPATT